MRSCIRLLKLVGVCAAAMLGTATAAPVPKDAAELYFPTTVGTKWVYAGDGGEAVHVVTAVEVKNKRTVVTVDSVEGETRSHVRTVAVSAEGLWLVAEGESNWERLWFKLPALASPPKTEPLYIVTVRGREKVEVPAGRFEAIRVDENNRHFLDSMAPTRTSYWFAPGVGIVKTSSKTGNENEKVEVLKSFTLGKP